jgi:hypothetical protein
MKHYSGKAKSTMKEKARRKEYDRKYGKTGTDNHFHTIVALKPVTGGPAYYCGECRKRVLSSKELVWVDGRGYCSPCSEHRIEHSIWKLRVTSNEKIEYRKIPEKAKSAEVEVLEIEPEAYIIVSRTIRTVVRPRKESDPAAVVKYVILGGDEYTSEAAWKSALRRLNERIFGLHDGLESTDGRTTQGNQPT